jgi:hypothetical protein
MQHDMGLAASPRVRYIFKVEGFVVPSLRELARVVEALSRFAQGSVTGAHRIAFADADSAPVALAPLTATATYWFTISGQTCHLPALDRELRGFLGAAASER